MIARRVLVVEDEMVVQLHLTRIVEELGHVLVGTAVDMEEALEVARAERPELVLTDIHLASGSDGVETARLLVRELECAVVFISAYADDATIERTEEVGAAGYLVKPFTVTQVRAAIATAFASHARLVRERQQARSLGTVLERIGGALFLVDSDDRISFANQSAADLVGWPVYKVYGLDIFKVLGTDAGAVELRAAMTQARAGHPANCEALQVRDYDGRERIVDIAMEMIGTAGSAGTAGSGESELLLSFTGHAAAAETAETAETAASPPIAETRTMPFGDGTRLMVYSHDTFGLGHLRRCMALIRVLCARFPGLSVLLVTGSPMVHRYAMPPGADYVKLPALQKTGVEQYEARSLQIPGRDIQALRSNLILHTARDYRPNVLLVDHSPRGGSEELLPTLAWLHECGGCIRILGLRDVVDTPEVVQDLWQRKGVYDLLEEHYDHVTVYGNRSIYDPIAAYAFPPEVAEKSVFVDYVCSGEGGDHGTVAARADAESEQPLVFVTIGGGDGGGETVIVPFLEMMRKFADRIDFRAEIVTGPFVGQTLRTQFDKLAQGLPVILHEFLPSIQALEQSAELVISTAGYNTTTDVLSYAQRSILIPRVLYRQEQVIRARRLGELGLCTFLHPDDTTPERLFETIVAARGDDKLVRARAEGLPLHGATRFAEFCSGLQVTVRTAPKEAVGGKTGPS